MNCALDTNILVYTMSPESDPRGGRARDLIIRGMRHGTVVLPLQSLAEFAGVATRKLRINTGTVSRRIDAWRDVLPVQPASEADLAAALHIVRQDRLGFWDALLCATAARIGLPYLITEDLQDGRSVGGLTIVNPFDLRNDALIDRILPR